jgi:sugar transferase (PEP-CTERM/EpsH1 system associated)
MSERLRILLVSTQFPFPPRSGFTQRVYQLARRLSTRHEVTLLSYADPGINADIDRLREEMAVEAVERAARSVAAKRIVQVVSAPSPTPFASRTVHSRELQRAIEDLAARTRFDVIQLESSLLCVFRLPRGPRLVLDEHNVESEVAERVHASEASLSRRVFSRLEYVRLRRFERRWWRHASGCAVTSEREARIVHRYAPATPVAVVPNGVDLEYFSPYGGAPQPLTVVFNGVLDYRPNLDAARHLVDEIWPLVLQRRPGARLAIVGRGDRADAERLHRPSVDVTGEVPDVRPHLARAAVVAVPIRMGGGTRLKVVEALAMGKPMVSTTLGCEGVDVRSGEHLLVADTATAFAEAVVRLFDDRAYAAALGSAGRARMEEQYSWDIGTARLEALYEQVAPRG